MSQGIELQVLDRFDSFSKAEGPEGQDVKALVDLKRDHIFKVLQKTGWRIEGKNVAAGILGINPAPFAPGCGNTVSSGYKNNEREYLSQ